LVTYGNEVYICDSDSIDPGKIRLKERVGRKIVDALRHDVVRLDKTIDILCPDGGKASAYVKGSTFYFKDDFTVCGGSSSDFIDLTNDDAITPPKERLNELRKTQKVLISTKVYFDSIREKMSDTVDADVFSSTFWGDNIDPDLADICGNGQAVSSTSDAVVANTGGGNGQAVSSTSDTVVANTGGGNGQAVSSTSDTVVANTGGGNGQLVSSTSDAVVANTGGGQAVSNTSDADLANTGGGGQAQAGQTTKKRLTSDERAKFLKCAQHSSFSPTCRECAYENKKKRIVVKTNICCEYNTGTVDGLCYYKKQKIDDVCKMQCPVCKQHTNRGKCVKYFSCRNRNCSTYTSI
jgi:hypothetical protein